MIGQGRYKLENFEGGGEAHILEKNAAHMC